MMNQEDKLSSQRKSYSENEKISAGSGEGANQPRKKWGQQLQPERKIQYKNQYAEKEEDDELANYIETMDKEDLEILKQSLVMNSNSKKKGYYRDNTSPERPLEEVEEDESIKGSNYDDGNGMIQKRNQYYNEVDDNDEEEKEIKEEIEESVESHSEVYASKQLKNNRVFSGNPYKQESKILTKPRPISAQVTIGGVANSLYQNSRDSKQKNYESSKNIGKWERLGGDEEESQLSEIHEKELEAMRNLNSNPFKIKAKKDVTKSQGNNINDESDKRIQEKKGKQQVGNLGKGEGLEKLFLKISKLKIGERQELEALIDKIDSGQVSVHALKSLLFEENGKNSFGNTNMHSEGSIESNIKKYGKQDDDDAIKPETIKFATLRRGQLDGHSITKGLFENTQALSNQLLLSDPNVEGTEKQMQDDLEEDEDEEEVNVGFGKNKFKDTMQLKQQKVMRNEVELEQEEEEEKDKGWRNERKFVGFTDDAQIDENYEGKEDLQVEKSASQGGRNSSANKKTFNLSKKKEKERSLINEIKEEKGEVFIIIRVISTWGSPHLAGLTEIKVYDERGMNIDLKGDNFLIDGGSQNSTRNFSRICDGIYDTTSEDHMWLCTMPCPPRCLEIGIRYKSVYGLGAMKIWNFNKSLIDSVKGFKEIQILRNQVIIHEDTIRQAPGKEHENYAHIIKLKRDIVLDDEKPKPPVHSSRTSLSQNPKESTPQIKKSTQKQSTVNLALPQPEDNKTKIGQKSCPPTSANSASSTPSARQRSKNPRDSISNDESSDQSSLKINQQQVSNNKNSSNNNLSTSTASSAQKNQESKIEQDLISQKAVLTGSNSKGQLNEPTKDEQSQYNQQYSSQTSSLRQEAKEDIKVAKVSSNVSSKKQNNLGLSSSETVEQQVKSSIKTFSSPVGIAKLPQSQPSVFDDNNKKANPASNITTNSQIKQNPKEIPAQQSAGSKIKQQQDEIFGKKDFQQSKVSKQDDPQNQQNKQQQLQRLSQDSANSGTNQTDSFMDHLKFFNATHKGRFLAADRELLLQNQANDAKEAVEQTLKSINSLLINGNPGSDRNQKQVFDPKSHFGFDDSDEYKALDVFLEVKKATPKITQDQGIGLNQSNGITSMSINNKGNSFNQSQKSIIDSHKKVILESPILEEMLREEQQLELEAGKNQNSNQLKLPNEKIFETNSKNEVAKSQIQEEKQNYQHSFLDKELQELLKSQNNIPDILVNQSNTMELLKSQGISNQLNQTDLLLQQLQASFQSNKPTVPSDTSSTFTIPQLPKGQLLRIEIFSTWGDSHYVGLSGLEFFDADGKPIVISNPFEQVQAAPKDINELPEYKEDPRTCDKLVDGCYLTCDDLHMWLAPFFEGRKNFIFIDFGKEVQLSMIRIWNYNKSRIHSFRGAKDIAVFLENKPIFAGQISKAPGSQAYAAEECEYIILTNKESLLEKIEANDWLSTYELPFIEEEQEMLDQLSRTQQLQRISTGNGYSSELQQSLTALPRSLIGKDGRPLTSTKTTKNIPNTDQIDKDLNSKANVAIEKQLKLSQQLPAKKIGVKCRKLRIQILKSYEDKNFVGLTGIELHDDSGNIIKLDKKQIQAKPQDLNDIPGYKGDQRTLDKLIDGVNLTTNETHMWCAQLLPNGQNYILIDLQEEKIISSIKIWNYNKIIQYENSQSLEPYRGASMISILADEVNLLTPPQGIQLRKAPGRDLFDYGQNIPLPFDEGWTPEIIESLKIPNSVATNFVQEYDTIYLPKGHCFRLNLLSTWGDAHYIGLNGIEFYDSFGSPIISSAQIDFKLAAEPASVNVLPGCSGDIRTIDKLVNGQNETFDDRNMWLAPFINQASDKKNTVNSALKLNTVFVYFEKPIILSAINFWNYTKTPNRGVREVEIFCDDRLIFRGYLKKAPNEEEFIQNKIPIQSTVIFNRNTIILKKISPVVYNEDKLQQAVLFSNEGKVDDEQRKRVLLNPQLSEVNNLLVRPNTKVSGMKH